MKRIFITGGAGFVGSHACEHFLKNSDWEIVTTDSFHHKGDSLRLKHLKNDPRIRIITHDLTTPISDRLAESIGPIDYILNIASESHVDRSISDPVKFCKNNFDLMLSILEYARKVKPAKFIHCSTDEIFGPAQDGVFHKEWDAMIPSNPYAASKGAQNLLAISYWRTFGVPLILTHCMNMFGERQDKEKFVPLLISKILKGEQVNIHGSENNIGKRTYLHCRNLADAWLFVLKEKNPTLYRDGLEQLQMPDAYNIAGEIEIDNLELARTIARKLGRNLQYQLVDFNQARPGHDKRYALDGNKIADFGWKSPLRFDQSLQKTIEWTKENPEWLI